MDHAAGTSGLPWHPSRVGAALVAALRGMARRWRRRADPSVLNAPHMARDTGLLPDRPRPPSHPPHDIPSTFL